MLRNPADRRTLVFVGLFYALVAYQWFLAPTNPVLATLLVIVTCISSWICAVITHNTVHCPVFKSRSLNRVFQVALTCSYGFPVSEYVPGHNLSHHKWTQKPMDLMRTDKVRFSWNLLNAIAFVPVAAPAVTAGNWRWISRMKKTHPAWHQQYLIEVFATWGLTFALVALDWRKALLYFFLPHLFALWGITAVNFVQHDGADEDHPYNHSRNFVGGWFNWLTFNNGFHGMHHVQPGLHWSLLREAHMRELHPHIHPALEQKSLFVYLFKTFILPGRRVRYDGQPVVLPPPRPDEDWVGKTTVEDDEMGAVPA